MLAAAWSAAGYSKKLQLAHWPSLLPSQPMGAQEILMLALTRRVVLIANRARTKLVGAWLGVGDDSIGISLPVSLLAPDVDEINALRAAFSAAVGDPAASPADGPLPLAQQPSLGHARSGPPSNGTSGSAVQAQLLRLLDKQRPLSSEADAAQAAAAIATALEVLKGGGDGAGAIDAERAAESLRLGLGGALLPPLISPLYDYSPEEMEGFN
ncbi:hypothetical protein T492DRAFT_1036514 [Pavlovales sp. CCMP2436]|nr:hypothetical protein T492DRAFT_1036514 [Pavlovales sp. CCMP2436]